jgi:tetratricopeptide (TPR) repeat protein
MRGLKGLIAATALLTVLPNVLIRAAGLKEQTCDVKADFFLGIGNYPSAIALHRSYLSAHPDNALAHYHLGFAYDMTGRDSEAINEYLKAACLGFKQWDLFLNLGLVYFEQQNYAKAIQALETSVVLGSNHAEAHFNLALAYEKTGRLSDAMKQILTALQLTPWDFDMRNTKAIICAESGDLDCAREEWQLLLKIAPNYFPARTNLAILMGAASQLAPLSAANALEIPRSVAVAPSSSEKPPVVSTQHAAMCLHSGSP